MFFIQIWQPKIDTYLKITTLWQCQPFSMRKGRLVIPGIPELSFTTEQAGNQGKWQCIGHGVLQCSCASCDVSARYNLRHAIQVQPNVSALHFLTPKIRTLFYTCFSCSAIADPFCSYYFIPSGHQYTVQGVLFFYRNNIYRDVSVQNFV